MIAVVAPSFALIIIRASEGQAVVIRLNLSCEARLIAERSRAVVAHLPAGGGRATPWPARLDMPA